MCFRTPFSHRRPHLAKYVATLGTFILCLPVGLPWYYGNLSSYLDSYFIARVGARNHDTESLWMMAVFNAALAVSLVPSGLLANKIGPRWTLLCGVLGVNCSMFLTYPACRDNSFWAMHVTLGAGAGFFSGLIYTMTNVYAVAWFPNARGVANSICMCAFEGGCLLLNPIITWFINPDAKVPDIDEGTSSYFSDDDVVSRVPSVFLMLGGITIGCQALGFLLLSDPPNFAEFFKSPESKLSENKDQELGHAPTEETNLNTPPNSCLQNSELQDSSLAAEKPGNFNNQVQYGGKLEILKSPSFYCLAISFFFMKYSFEVELNSYKQFGFKYIKDDYFLTSIGILINVTTPLFRIVWGLLVDRADLKSCFVAQTSLHTIIAAFWCFTALLDRWVYLVWTLLVQGVMCGSMTIYPVLILSIFGPANYVTNYGFVLGCGVLLVFAAPLCVQGILNAFGYFWLFFSASVSTALALGLALILPWSTRSSRNEE